MATNSSIVLENTTDVVIGFFESSIHSILYQRGVYPSEDFQEKRRFGTTMMMSLNPDVNDYLDEMITQFEAWVKKNHVSKWVLVIKSKETDEVLERWQFDVNVVNKSDEQSASPIENNDMVAKQIRAIMRQIINSTSFLPILDDDDCTFNVLVYASENAEVPTNWADADANLIRGGGEHVRLHSLSTHGHKIDPVVSYRFEESF